MPSLSARFLPARQRRLLAMPERDVLRRRQGGARTLADEAQLARALADKDELLRQSRAENEALMHQVRVLEARLTSADLQASAPTMAGALVPIQHGPRTIKSQNTCMPWDAERPDAANLAAELRLLGTLCEVNLASAQTVLLAARWCEEKGATSLHDIARCGMIEPFIKAIALKPVAAMQLSRALERGRDGDQLASMVSTLVRHATVTSDVTFRSVTLQFGTAVEAPVGPPVPVATPELSLVESPSPELAWLSAAEAAVASPDEDRALVMGAWA